jgi:hypothetical protein
MIVTEASSHPREGVRIGYRTGMDTGLFWLTIAILVLMAVIGVVAAFYDRKRGRRIERDLRRRYDEDRP